MAQICVVNCCSCGTFQGQLVKKGKKWPCKMCGEKQSFRKIFAQGSGKECRQVVQKLNMIGGNLKRQMLEEHLQEHDEESKGESQTDDQNNEECSGKKQTSESKWSQFVETVSKDETITDESNEEDLCTTERATFNKHKSQKRKKLMKGITSYGIQQRKTPKFDRSKETCPYNSSNKTSETHVGNLNNEVSDVAPLKLLPRSQDNERKCGGILIPKRPAQTCSSIKSSKWLKYT